MVLKEKFPFTLVKG